MHFLVASKTAYNLFPVDFYNILLDILYGFLLHPIDVLNLLNPVHVRWIYIETYRRPMAVY